MVGAQWITRGLGLVSTAILARLLAPQDFGLVAMATVIAGFLGVLFTFGIDTALIQNTNATRADWDAAWTIRVGQGIILALLLVVTAPLAALFYAEPRVTVIILVLAAGAIVAGFENIGIVAFRKDLQFHRDFQYTLAKKIVQIAVTITLAFIFHNYWALLAGIVLGQAFSSLASYMVHPFRPRWSLARTRHILGFTSRMAFINLAQYITLEGERFIVGGLTGIRQTGLYFVSNEVANIPTTELSGSISRATVPGLAKLKHDRERLRAGYLNVFGFVALFSLPAGVGVAIVAGDLVPVMLGPQWTDAVSLVQLLAVAGALRAVSGPAYNLLIVLGRLNMAAMICWFQTISQIILLVPVIGYFGLVGAATLNCALAGLTLAIYVVQIERCSGVSLWDHLSVLWRPVVSTLLMVAICSVIPGIFAVPVIELTSTILVGASSYTLVGLVLWLISGRPRGPEQHLLEMIGRRFDISLTQSQ